MVPGLIWVHYQRHGLWYRGSFGYTIRDMDCGTGAHLGTLSETWTVVLGLIWVHYQRHGLWYWGSFGYTIRDMDCGTGAHLDTLL